MCSSSRGTSGELLLVLLLRCALLWAWCGLAAMAYGEHGAPSGAEPLLALPLPLKAVGNGSAVEVVPGGSTDSPPVTPQRPGRPSPAGLSWATLATAPWGSRGGHCSVVANGKLFVIAGSNENSAALHDVWSTADGVSWNKATASAGFAARSFHGCAVASSG
eukprot:RCo022759